MDRPRIATEISGRKCFGVLLDKHGLLASSFGNDSKSVRKHLEQYSRSVIGRPPSPAKTALVHDMVKLFDGQEASKKVRFNVEHLTSYQSRVLNIVSKIPRGKVTTYGLIAKKLGSGPRAVGNAVANNPWPLFVPCQRVVPSTLAIGNYTICGQLGKQGSETKRELLEREDIQFKDNTISTSALWIPVR